MGIGDGLGQAIIFLLFVSCIGLGAVASVIFAVFGVTGPWLLAGPVAGAFVGIIVRKWLGD